MWREKQLGGVRVKMSVKHNDESSEQKMRGARISKGIRQEEIEKRGEEGWEHCRE